MTKFSTGAFLLFVLFFAHLLVGSVELLQALGHGLGLSGPFWSWLGALDFSTLGYSIVGLFALTWALALAIWRWGRIEERWNADLGGETN